MNTVEIVEEFSKLLGVTGEKGMEYYTICKGAEESVRLMLIDKNSEALYPSLLCRAAAALAYYRYTLVKTAETPSGGYQVRDIRVGACSAENTEAARKLWYQSLNDLSGIVKDTDFIFRRI